MGGSTKIWSGKGSSSGVNRLSVESSITMKKNVWYQVAITADNGNAALYIDGVKAGTGGAANSINDNTQTYLGVNFWDTPFDGLIDDLYIYNGTTLTDEQVTNLFEATNK